MRVFNISGISSRAFGDFEAEEPYPTSIQWEPEGEPYYCPNCGKNVWNRDLMSKRFKSRMKRPIDR
jgi:predicted RNA-binding Zn-ribbon protein involved in translation (DUF1610 family)